MRHVGLNSLIPLVYSLFIKNSRRGLPTNKVSVSPSAVVIVFFAARCVCPVWRSNQRVGIRLNKCAVIPRRTRFVGSWTFVSLTFRLGSNEEEEDMIPDGEQDYDLFLILFPAADSVVYPISYVLSYCPITLYPMCYPIPYNPLSYVLSCTL